LENLTYTTKCGVLQEGGELTWWGVWLWIISGSYSEEMMGLSFSAVTYYPTLFTNFQMMFPSLSYPVMSQVAWFEL